MSSVKFSLFAAVAAAVTISAGSAHAADLPAPVYEAPAPVECCSGWYLRGDIGMTNQRVKSAENVQIPTAPGFAWLDKMSFDSGMLYGLGIGYNFNSWLRFDLTGQYRGKTPFHGFDRYDTGTNDYTGNKSEWLFLANAYVDLGTWWCITPFIGAGVGVAQVTLSHFHDVNVPTAGGGYADSASKTNFAWALHAGLGYQVSKNLTVELAYSYVNLGTGMTGDVINFDGSNLIYNPWTFKDITSHDVKIGVRWTCCDDRPQPVTYAPAPPLMRKG